MKWQNDPLKYEKYILYDGIIEFSKNCEGKEFCEISLDDLTNFIDKFFKEQE